MSLHPIMAEVLAPFAPPGSVLRRPDTYRGWQISYDYPPIPIRDFDWSATSPDYDGEGDDRIVHARTREAVMREIDFWHEENAE